MALFRKKPKTPNLEPELAALRQRADALDAKRKAAEAELTAATEARQRHHIEGDLDDANTAQVLQDRVNAAASQVVGLEDAIAVVQAQIADIERKLDAERTQAGRNEAADKLACDLDGIEKALPAYLMAARKLADAVEAVAHFHYEANELGTVARNWAAQIEVAGAFAVAELRGMVEQIKTGAASIPPAKPKPAPVSAPEPTPETRRLFALRPIRWTDANGCVRSCLQYEDCDLTPAAAQRGLRIGAVCGLDDPRRKSLKGAHGGRHGNPDGPNICDLDAIEDWSGARYIGPDVNNVAPQVTFTPVDRGPERKMTIPVSRVL
jgi:hypothetical protein